MKPVPFIPLEKRYIPELKRELRGRDLQIWDDTCVEKMQLPCPDREHYIRRWKAIADGTWTPALPNPATSPQAKPKRRIRIGSTIRWITESTRFTRIVEAYNARVGEKCDCPLRQKMFDEMTLLQFTKYLVRVLIKP